MAKKCMDWIINFDLDDEEALIWLTNYFRNRRPNHVRSDYSKIKEALKRYIIMMYEHDLDEDHRFLTNMQAAYIQFEKRRNRGDKVSRTYEISVQSDKQLKAMSESTKVSKNEIVDTFIRESSRLYGLFSDKKKQRKMLTVKDIVNPFAREMGVSDFIFGSKTFPDEASLGKKVYGFISKLNKQANANSGQVDPLEPEHVLTLMIREGVIHNINKSIASRSAPGLMGRQLTGEEIKRTIDDLRIDDVFPLEESTITKLQRYRQPLEIAHQKHLNREPLREEFFIEKLVTDAQDKREYERQVNELEERVSELLKANQDLKATLDSELQNLKFDDNEMEHQRTCIKALGELVLSLVNERNAARDKVVSAHLRQTRLNDYQGVSKFELEAKDKSIKSFRQLLQRVQVGKVSPDEITSVTFSGPEFPKN